MKDKIFGVLQRVGRSFMLPIALLPVAGLLLGIGSSFTNETMLAAYGLNSVIHPRYPDLHHSGRDEPDRQRRVQQSGAAVRHGRGHRHGPQGKKRWPPCPVQWLISL